MDIIAIVSGGLDSVTMAYYLKQWGNDLHILSFNYGQRHSCELANVRYHAKHLGAYHDEIDLTCFGNTLVGSALTDDSVPVPTGDYTQESLKTTIVPNRNAMFITIGYAFAVMDNTEAVAVGVHAGDHPVYPDCRPEFITQMERAMQLGTDTAIQLVAPFAHKSKSDIIKIGSELGVPFEKTWSCYIGGDAHCGQCSTCRERRQSFIEAGIEDPTSYVRKPQ